MPRRSTCQAKGMVLGSTWANKNFHHTHLVRRSSCNGEPLPQQKKARIADLSTEMRAAHFIFTSNSKSFLEDTCLLTARGKTASLGKCSGFDQSLQLLQHVRQALQCLTDKTLQPHEHDNYGEKKIAIFRE